MKENNQRGLREKVKLIPVCDLLLIIALGLLLTFPSLKLNWSLLDDPAVIQVADELISYVKAGQLLKFLSFFGAPTYSSGPTFILISVIQRLLLNNQPALFHLTKIIWFVLFLLAVYLVAGQIYGHRVARLCSVLLAALFNPSGVFQDFQASFANWYRLYSTDSVYIVFALLAVYFFLRLLREPKPSKAWQWLFLSSLLFIAASLAKLVAIHIALSLVLFVLLLYLMGRSKDISRKVIIALTIFSVFSVIIYLYWRLCIQARIAYAGHWQLSWANFSRGFYVYRWFLLDAYHILLPLALVYFTIRFLSHIFGNRKDYSPYPWLLIFCAMTGFGIMVFWPHYYPRYMLTFYPYLAILIAGELTLMCEGLLEVLKRRNCSYLGIKIFISIVVVLILIFIAFYPLYTGSQQSPGKFRLMAILVALIMALLVYSAIYYIERRTILPFAALTLLGIIGSSIIIFMFFPVFGIVDFLNYYFVLEKGNEKAVNLIIEQFHQPGKDQVTVAYVSRGFALISAINLMFKHLYGIEDIAIRWWQKEETELPDGVYFIDYNISGHQQFEPPDRKIFAGLYAVLDQHQPQYSNGVPLKEATILHQTFKTGPDTYYIPCVTIYGDNVQWRHYYDVTLKLKKHPTDRQALGQSTIKGLDVPYGRSETIVFPFARACQVMPGQTYCLELSARWTRPAKPGDAPLHLLFTDNNDYPAGEFYINQQRQNGDLAFITFRGIDIGLKKLASVSTERSSIIFSSGFFLYRIYKSQRGWGYNRNFLRPIKYSNNWDIYLKEATASQR